MRKVEVTEREARAIIEKLCKKIGVPVPALKITRGGGYVEGIYDEATMEITINTKTGKISLEVLIHEFLHYIFHLIRATSENNEEENIEHRFVDFLVSIVVQRLGARVEKKASGNRVGANTYKPGKRGKER
ncbi:MAG: hypothetical protein QXF58_04245 [Desulfurococcaceae archaeon]